MTQPIVKWVGGKGRLVPELVKRMPPTYNRYYEPFMGGGALFFHQAPPVAVIGDANKDLFNLYTQVKSDHVERVITIVKGLEAAWQSQTLPQRGKLYRSTVELWNSGSGGAEGRAATFLFLNRTCFNGLWRVNSKGHFNVPMGDYPRDHVICDASKLRHAHLVLQRATIRCGDYWRTCGGAYGGDFVYFDPPYDPVSASANFTSYTKDGFGREAQDLLAHRASDLAAAGVHVMLSNADTPYIRSLYRGFKRRGKPVFTLHKVQAARALNANTQKRGKVGELIITGGY